MMDPRTHALASCLVNARRESRALEAAYDVIGLMLNQPETPVAKNIKRKAKYYKVRIDEVHAAVKRLTEAMGLKEL